MQRVIENQKKIEQARQQAVENRRGLQSIILRRRIGSRETPYIVPTVEYSTTTSNVSAESADDSDSSEELVETDVDEEENEEEEALEEEVLEDDSGSDYEEIMSHLLRGTSEVERYSPGNTEETNISRIVNHSNSSEAHSSEVNEPNTSMARRNSSDSESSL